MVVGAHGSEAGQGGCLRGLVRAENQLSVAVLDGSRDALHQKIGGFWPRSGGVVGGVIAQKFDKSCCSRTPATGGLENEGDEGVARAFCEELVSVPLPRFCLFCRPEGLLCDPL
jgi:hypothetical protein